MFSRNIPACPTNIPSITNKSCDGVKEMMIQVGGHVNPCKKYIKSSGGVGGGGSPPHDVVCRSDDLNRGAITSLQKV